MPGPSELERELARYGALEDYLTPKSALLTGQIMEGAALSTDYARMVKQLPARQIVNGARSIKGAAAATAVTVGFADYVIKATDDKPLGELLDVLEASTTVRNVTSDVMRAMVEQAGLIVFEQVVERIMAKVPIVGWIAQAGLVVVEIIRKIRLAMANDTPPPRKPAFVYDKETDEEKVHDSLARFAAGGDLTELFLPSATVPRIVAENIDIVYGFTHGVRLRPVGGSGGHTHVPGLADLGSEVQYPTYGSGGSVHVGRGVAQSWGSLHPSAAQLSLVLWQAVIKNGPLAFQIDGEKIAGEWEAYYTALLMFALEGKGKWLHHRWAMISQVAAWASYAGKAQQVKGLGCYFPEQSEAHGLYPTAKCPTGKCGERSRWTCVPARYVQWYGSPNLGIQARASRGGLVRYFVEQQWQAKLRYYLGTLTCAYVPAGAPALRADRDLATYHEEMRTLLLTHKARYKVDMDMVPDDGTGYRNDLARSRMAAPTKGLAAAPVGDMPEPKVPAIVAKVIDNVPPVDPGLEGASGDLAPNDPAIPGPDVSSGSLVGLLIAAGAGALLLGTLKGVK